MTDTVRPSSLRGEGLLRDRPGDPGHRGRPVADRGPDCRVRSQEAIQTAEPAARERLDRARPPDHEPRPMTQTTPEPVVDTDAVAVACACATRRRRCTRRPSGRRSSRRCSVGRWTVREYARFVAQLRAVYEALEDEVAASTDATLAPLFAPELVRAAGADPRPRAPRRSGLGRRARWSSPRPPRTPIASGSWPGPSTRCSSPITTFATSATCRVGSSSVACCDASTSCRHARDRDLRVRRDPQRQGLQGPLPRAARHAAVGLRWFGPASSDEARVAVPTQHRRCSPS